MTLSFFLFLLGCDNLTVFIPSNSKATISELSGVSLTDEGRLSLEWASDITQANGSYDIYLLEVDPADALYRFSDKAIIDEPLTYETISVDTANTPRKIGVLLDKVTSLNFIVQDILIPGKTYAIEVIDSRTPLKLNSKIVLLRIEFESSEAGAVTSEEGYSHLVWNKVIGANRYEVYTDAEFTQKIGDSSTNTLRVKHPSTGAVKDYYVKAYRGLLPAQGSIKISLSSSLARITKVRATSPDGKYRAGDVLDFEVIFSQKVSSFGTPILPLSTNSKTVAAEYVSGSGSDTLTFRYTVAQGDDVAHLSSGALLEGEFIDEANLTLAATLPIATSPESLKQSSLIAIDTISPSAPSSIGYSTAYSASGNVSVSWTSSSDINFFGHRLKLCSDVQCSLGCGPEQFVASSTLALTGLTEGIYYACVKGEDSHGNQSASIATLTPVRVDSTSPTVNRVFAQSSAGSYSLGETITLAVSFDEAVIVTGDLRLSLAPGGAPHDAIYVSGSGTSTLLFNYVVQNDDLTADLSYGNTSSLAFAGPGSVVDQSGNNANLTLPATGDALSLAGQSAIALDGVIPTVSRVYALTANGSYTDPAAITLAVEMSEVVQLTNPNNLRLALATGGTTRYAAYAAGSGTSTLQFTYTISIGDESLDLDYLDTTSLSFNGAGTLQDPTGNTGSLTLPAPASPNSLAGQSQILVDALNPTVTRVYATSADGIYGASTDVLIAVEMSEAISLSDPSNLRLQLETGATDRFALYDSMSGADTIIFRYTVVAADVAGDLNYLNLSALAFNGSGTVLDALSNEADLALPALAGANSLAGQSSISIDTSDFQVERVYATTANGVYNAGETIEIAVEFNKIVTLTDSVNLKLTLGTGIFKQDADYLSGSGSTTLLFNYIVQAGDTSPDLNYDSSTALSYRNGSTGTVIDPGSQVATLFLPALGSADSLAGQSAIVIDTLAPAVALVYAVSPDGPYRAGATLQIAVELTEDVAITGVGGMTLELALDDGPEIATYTSASDAKTLLFEYTVQAGDTAADLDYTVLGALTKSGTLSLMDAAGNETVLTLPAPAASTSLAGQSAIVLDTTAPTVQRVYAQTSNGSYRIGTTLALKVEFDEPVTVAAPSTMTLALATGVVHEATLIGGSGTDTLDFTYAIQAGDNSADLDYAATTSLILTGGSTLKDAAGNDGNLTLPALASANSLAGQADLVVDTTAPTIIRVTAQTANGSYTAPSPINIILKFSELVNLTDVANLRLAIDANAAARNASYISGTGSDEVIVRYVVQNGDESPDLNYVATNSLSFMTSGDIKDAVGNTSLLELPALVSGNSLAGQSAIVIDAVAPNAPVITVPVDNATVTSPVTSTSGTAEANSTVEVFKDSVSQGTTTADGSGNWTFNLSPSLLNGTYTLGARARDALNNTGATSEIDVTVAIPPPTANAGVDIYTASTQTAFGTSTNAVSRIWTKVSGPGTITFGTPTADTTTVSADTQGVYVLRLSATNANNDVVSDDMTLTWDTTAPSFRGLQFTEQKSATSARLFWAGASDTYTNHKEITYELCFNSVSGSCASNFVVAHTFASNVYDFIKTGLTPDVNYEFLIRAIDKAGNSSTGGGSKNSLGLRNTTQVAGGGQSFCALMDDQTVKCWGANNLYQLGLGGTITTNQTVPTTVPGLTGVRSIALGITHACAIMNDDTVKCWGENQWGNLGDGTVDNRSSPVTVSGLSNVEAIGLGHGFTCALIKVSGAVSCWGSGEYGRLGNGLTANSSTPVAVTGITGATQLSLGNSYACVVLGDKTAKCWGRGTEGQLGHNLFSHSSTPVVPSITDVEQLDLAETTSCAVVTGGAVKCWGNGVDGRLGTGSVANVSVPTALPDLTSGVASVTGGWPSHCALMLDGTVKCWGDAGFGQMASNTTTDELTPRTIPGLSGITKLGKSNDTICAISAANAVICWGRDDSGQTGDGSIITRVSPTTLLGLGGTPTQVQMGVDHACALMSDKTVKCWGSNQFGQLGNTSLAIGHGDHTFAEPKIVTGLSNVEVLKVGRYHNCAILTDTTVRCWGYNIGRLGNNLSTSTAAIQTVVSTSGTGSLSNIKELVIGRNNSCAIDTGGAMYCWGDSNVGLLGDGRSAVTSLYPVAATAFTQPIRTGAAGNDHMCVILDDVAKTVQCVGKNNYYQLADGTTTDRATPYATTTGATHISTKHQHSCIIATDQSVKCWGPNNLGQLGQSNLTAYSSVRTVPSLSGVTSLTTGGEMSCAVLADNTTSCWGENNEDRLGLPALVTDTNQHTPQPTTGLTGVLSISADHASVCAFMLDATIKCWGYNNKSQTGVSRRSGMIFTPTQELLREAIVN